MAVVAVEHKEWRLTRLREFIYLSAFGNASRKLRLNKLQLSFCLTSTVFYAFIKS